MVTSLRHTLLICHALCFLPCTLQAQLPTSTSLIISQRSQAHRGCCRCRCGEHNALGKAKPLVAESAHLGLCSARRRNVPAIYLSCALSVCLSRGSAGSAARRSAGWVLAGGTQPRTLHRCAYLSDEGAVGSCAEMWGTSVTVGGSAG